MNISQCNYVFPSEAEYNDLFPQNAKDLISEVTG